MVMEVIGAYGDWRQTGSPTRQTPPSAASTREHTPVNYTPDVNFNSPGHRSSQDGSFIQDEDMQLILEFGAKGSSPNKGKGIGQTVGVLSESWMHRHAKWASDFDANVAELDFDQFSRQDIRTLRKAAAAYVSKNGVDEPVDMVWDSFTTTAHDAIPVLDEGVRSGDCNHNKVRNAPPCNSLDASLAISAGSLFSSAGDGGTNNDSVATTIEDQVALVFNNVPSSLPAFISTDSLDISVMAGQEELIRAACTTKKRDYVLTFDRVGISESGVGGSEDTDYQDARLSNAVERSLLNGFDTGAFDAAGQEDNDSSFVNWGRIRRSYETDRRIPYDAYNDRFTSLPNLINCLSTHGRESTDEIGGGERMFSRNGDHCVPLYELKRSGFAPDISISESINYGEGIENDNDGGSRISLLKAFKSKLSGTCDRLPLPQLHHGTTTEQHSFGDSSGYMTGTGSQQGYGIAGGTATTTTPGTGNKAKHQAGDKECDLRTHPASSTTSKEQVEEMSNGRRLQTDDYNYAEFYINGRYIDINHNEIGFVPPSTRGIQKAASSQQHRNEPSEVSLSPPPQLTSFHQQAAKFGKAGNSNGVSSKPRTFATLLKQQQADEDAENANNGAYILRQRPERAPYGRRILPKIPDETQVSVTEISRMKDSATQVPVYVVDQSVQTNSSSNSQHPMLVVTTCVTKTNIGAPCYVGSGIQQAGTSTAVSSSKLTDWRKMVFGTSNNSIINMPELNFLKFPFNVPQLFPHVPPFPLAFLTDGPDITSFIAKQAEMINAGEDQLAAPKRVLPSPPPPFSISKQAATLINHLPLPQKVSPNFKLSSSTSGARRDSGLGFSGGPSHIQDWESLATLLPQDVLQACSIFKTNTNPLGKSAPILRQDLNIDKRTSRHNAQCCGYSNCGRKLNKRSTEKTGVFGQCRNHRLGKKQRPLSEPAFKKKQCESIIEEEDKICSHGCNQRCASKQMAFDCSGNQCHSGSRHSHHHHHSTTWCCGDQTPEFCEQCSNCHSLVYHQKVSHCQKRSTGHTCAGDTDDTEEEEVLDEHWYKPLNQVAEAVGGVCSDDERLMPSASTGQQNQFFTCSEDEDEDEEELQFPSAPFRGTHSEYQVRNSSGTRVPKFFSVQNVKEISQFGYPLKRLAPAQLTCASEEAVKPCATCYRVRSPSRDMTDSGSMAIAMNDQVVTDGEDFDFCDCKTSDILDELTYKKGQTNGKKHNICKNCDGIKPRKRNQNDERVDLPLLQQKRALVQGVVAACDTLMKHLVEYQRSEAHENFSFENAKTASGIIRYSLCPTVERLVADGLQEGKSLWNVVLASATLGPATKSIYELVTDLDKSVGETGERSLLFVAFVNGLLRLRSLDCWLSYLALKDKILSENYNESAFIRKATTTYRNLFDEVLGAIQALSILSFDQMRLNPLAISSAPPQTTIPKVTSAEETESSTDDAFGSCEGYISAVSLHKEIVVTFQKPSEHQETTISLPSAMATVKQGDINEVSYSLIPTRLPSDSRVPKSSSVPSKLVRNAAEPPKSKSIDSGLKSGVSVGMAALKAIVSPKRLFETPKSTNIQTTPTSTRPSRIPVLKSSRSCPDGPRQRSLFGRFMKNQPVMNLQSVESESPMSVSASSFSENDMPDANLFSDLDYRSAEARYVYAIDDQQSDQQKGLLAFAKGDTMVLLDEKDNGFLRCQRADEVGLVPRKKVTFVTFL